MLTIERIQTIRKVTRRLYFVYTGHTDGWEDAAQHICMKHLEGVGLHQDLRHSLIDYLRSPHNLKNFSTAQLPKTLATIPHEHEVKTVEDLATCLNLQQQSAVILYFKYEYSLKEIGEALGVTESRACQIVKKGIYNLRIKIFGRPK